jgi:uncharacterized protein (TIGR03382 family)
MSRKAFVAVVSAAGVGLFAGAAAANPPAPSSVPDPVASAVPKTGEVANRIKRHDGGCWLHFESGAVAKTTCPSVMDKAGEQIERETESGQCILIEPWGEEPKETPCPPVLVPAGFKTPPPPASALVPASASAKPAALAPTEPAQKSGCAAGCTTTGHAPLSSAAPALALAATLALRRRRR